MMEDCTRKDAVFFVFCFQTSALPGFFISGAPRGGGYEDA